MDSERVHDWIVTAMAVAMAALWMGVMTGPPRASRGDVWVLEDFGRIHDAGSQYPTIIRDLIGLEGTAEDTPAAVVEAARARATELPPSQNLRVVVAAMAAAWGVTDAARAELSAIGSGDAVSDATRHAVEDLVRLSQGASIDTLGRVTATLTDIGASPWLLARVRARFCTVTGDEACAAEADQAAKATAVAVIDAVMIRWIVLAGLVVLGLFALFALPLVRPRLARAGHGLGPGPAPFLLARTQRVVASAFIVQILVAIFFGSFVTPELATQPATVAAVLDLQMLAHGAIWLGLIQRLGRDPDDHRSLASVLGLGVGATPGRGWTVAGWILPGLAMCTFAVVAGQLVSLFIFEPPASNQGPVELLTGDTGAGTFGLVLLGAAVIAPLTEEVLFRGFLFRSLRGTVGVGTAAVFSGLVFGAVHLDPGRLVPLSVLGAMLALLYEWSGTLLVPVIVHGAWNLLQLVGVWAIYHGS
ncbi:MAG: CPBP family intramembrane metalloprotease [Deltaproteobacteria bacterium]|nr:MAG: CPBP family intramembrane metalloprotease [Deltaproteobacteria bacterium]